MLNSIQHPVDAIPSFTFETVACLGACALSPVLLVDKTYYGKLTPAKVEQVLKQYA
jgi:NADH:ubiquinone oxidoreductase subunit E